MKVYRVYTDGACSGNPGPGGWGVVIVHNNQIDKLDGHDPQTTNNRMELLAVIVALESIKKENSEIKVYSDSKYVVDSVEKKWVYDWERKSFNKKKNPDLWIRFLIVYRKHNVSFVWVKGHANNKENERCDFLAVQAAESCELDVDVWYEKNTSNKQQGLF